MGVRTMSVINQMLVDLERRRASGEERNRIPDHVRALPGELPARRPWWPVAGGVLLAGAGLAAFWWWKIRLPDVQPPALPALSAAPAVKDAPGIEAIAQRLSMELSRLPEAAEAVSAPAQVTAAAVIAPRPPAPSSVPTDERPRAVPAAAPPVKKTAKPEKEEVAPPAGRVEIDKQVRELTPRQRAEAEYAKGTAALHQGQIGEARAAFENALQIHPAHHYARQALVGVLLDSRRLPDAMRVLQDGLQLAPAQHGFAMTLARLQVEAGDLDAGTQTLGRSLEHPGASPDHQAFYAGLLQRQQRHAEAVQQFQQALGRRSNVGVWLLGIGVSLEALGRNADAQEAYRRAKASGNLSAELQAFAEQRLR